MCRLVAYAGPPMELRPLVFGGTHSLFRQSWAPREMLHGSVNADGYGVGWYHEGEPVRLARTVPIWHEPDLEALLGAVRSPLAVALLRNATPGLPVDLAGVPPLVLDRWTFGLNGFVGGFREDAMWRLHRQIPRELYGQLRGTSDTEALFLLAVAELRDGAGPGEALRRVRDRVSELVGKRGEEAQLNMILGDGREITLLRTSSTDRANSLYTTHGHALAPRGSLAASEPLDDEEAWTPVPVHSLVRLRPDGPPQVEALDG